MADVEISTAHAEARLVGSLAALEVGPDAPVLQLFTGPQPSPGGAATVLLAEIPLTDPAGLIETGPVLMITPALPIPIALASGAVAWGRLVDGNGDWHTDLAAGLTGSGKPIQMDDLTLFAGGKVLLALCALA